MPAGFAPTGKNCTYGAYLNPQDPSGFADSGDLSHLFSPLKIGHVTLKNRIVKSAAGSEMQDNTVWPSDAALAYYGQFCDGVSPTPAGVNSLDITTDEGIRRFTSSSVLSSGK